MDGTKAAVSGDYSTDQICLGDKCTSVGFRFLELTSIDKRADNFKYWGGACGISPSVETMYGASQLIRLMWEQKMINRQMFTFQNEIDRTSVEAAI